MSVKAFKGFDKNLRCRAFQYEVGKTFESDKAELCASGFHACEYPLDVFCYYPPSTSRYAEVELDGVSDERRDDDTKVCAQKITIKAELDLPGIIKAAVEYIFAHAKKTGKKAATGDRGAASATGDQGAASATGYRGAASATGDQGAASATGYQGAASATGYQGAASATGDRGAASATGDQSIACAHGIYSSASGSLGNWIVLSEWSDESGEWQRINVKAFKVDGKRIKPEVFYTLKNGKPVEAER